MRALSQFAPVLILSIGILLTGCSDDPVPPVPPEEAAYFGSEVKTAVSDLQRSARSRPAEIPEKLDWLIELLGAYKGRSPPDQHATYEQLLTLARDAKQASVKDLSSKIGEIKKLTDQLPGEVRQPGKNAET